MIVRQLLTRLAFDADTSQAKKYGGALQTVRRVSVGLVAVQGALNAGLALFIRRMAAAGNETAKSAVEAGMATDQYQELRFVMQRISQVSQNELDRALGNTNIRLQRAVSEGGAYADVLRDMGHSVSEVADGSFTAADAFDRITEMAQNSETQAQATTVAYQLFGDRVARRLIPALQRAGTDVDALRKRFRDLGGGFTEDGAKAAEAFEDASLDLSTALRAIRIELAEELIPAATELVTAVADWVVQNREIIRQRLHRAIELVTRAASFLWGLIRRVTTAVNNVVTQFTDWETVMRLVIAAFGGMIATGIVRWLAVTLTGALGTATAATRTLNGAIRTLRNLLLIGLFAAAIEDLHQWANENDSVTGRVLGTWGNFKENLDAIWDDLNNNPRQFLDAVNLMMQDMGRAMMRPLLDLQESIENLFSDMWQSIVDSMPPLLKDLFSDDVQSHGGIFGGLQNMIERRQEMGSLGTSRPTGASVTIDSTVNLQIPEGTAEAQRSFLRVEAMKTFEQFWNREVRDANFAFPQVD